MISVLADKTLRFRLRTRAAEDVVTTTLISTGTVVTADTWTHAAVTYDGQNMKIFKDGAECAAVAKQVCCEFDVDNRDFADDLKTLRCVGLDRRRANLTSATQHNNSSVL